MKTITSPRSRFANVLATAAALGVSASLAGTSSILTDLELSLVTDTSGSVSSAEYDLQMDGYAAAFRNPVVHSAISSGARGSIAVNLILFDSNASVGLPWTILTGASDANAFADLLDNLARPSSGGTNPASGIDLATSEIFGNNIESTRQVIDVSGDGDGFSSTDAAARDAALAAGVDAINGLPILDGSTSLEDYYRNYIQGGADSFVLPANSFADFEAAILDKLSREIGGDTGVTGHLISSTLRSTSITTARTVTRDVGGRLYKMRAGLRSEPVIHAEPAPSSSKGGMAKGGMPTSPITHSHICRWEVYGQVFYSTEDLDAQYTSMPIGSVNVRRLLQADTSVDVFGGTVGFDYDFNDTWTAGFAVSGAQSDVDMNLVGTSDIDTLALIPYVSYHRDLNGMGFYADLLYAYGMNDYDTRRLPAGAVGSTEGEFNNFEFNTGLVMRSGQVSHGPYAQVRYLDGDIDGYTEVGPGAAVFPDSDYESLATQLGYQGSYVVQMGSGVLVPQARVAWEHEFEADQGNFAGVPLGTLDEDLAVLGAGIGYFMNCGWNILLDYEARLGDESQSHYVGLKAGVEF
ncbi:DUF1194 domain-containing protein [Haloferula chungangensis]|uniref:DUF1194 domain-containing protein n=1 Tax=Haloferula chungangensis TaxID=1048331 RepID=A0ABW2LAG9_9BACT